MSLRQTSFTVHKAAPVRRLEEEEEEGSVVGWTGGREALWTGWPVPSVSS